MGLPHRVEYASLLDTLPATAKAALAGESHLDFAPPFTPATAFALAVSTCLT